MCCFAEEKVASSLYLNTSKNRSSDETRRIIPTDPEPQESYGQMRKRIVEMLRVKKDPRRSLSRPEVTGFWSDKKYWIEQYK